MSELTGKTLGRYRVLERIGRGGMAEVYKAFQPALDR
jgi:serine/threonine protein kinase